MKKSVWRNSLLFACGAVLTAMAAVNPAEWRHGQNVQVSAPGLTRLEVPVAALDAAENQYRDLRLLDPAGREVPFALQIEYALPEVHRPAAAFRTELRDDRTILTIATGLDDPLREIRLATAEPHFVKAAEVEFSADGENWTSHATGLPLFRQWGAENLRLPLSGAKAAHVRITLRDERSRPVVFTGAHVVAMAGEEPTPGVMETRIVRTEEFAGETVLTLQLAGRNAPLARLEFEVADPLFTRRVSIAVRTLQQDQAGEQVIAEGSLFRLRLDGAPAREQLAVELRRSVPQRELLVHVHHGDSPPLDVRGVRVLYRPVKLTFLAAEAGSYRLLSGNPGAAAPRYDLAALGAELRRATAHPATVGSLETNPAYRAPDALAGLELKGGAFAPDDWRQSLPVQTGPGRVQELELTPAVLAQAQPGLADLRLVRGGQQVPYLLEPTRLERTLPVQLTRETAEVPANSSRWKLTLPHAKLPVHRVVFSSPTPLFRRELVVTQRLRNSRGETYTLPVGRLTWQRTPDDPRSATAELQLAERPAIDTLFIETHDGDNPPIELQVVRATYLVTRLVFPGSGDADVALHFDNPRASAPRYDVELIARQLLAAERQIAQLPSDASATPTTRTRSPLASGPIFWGALALVVIVLLATVAKLLPKPPAA